MQQAGHVPEVCLAGSRGTCPTRHRLQSGTLSTEHFEVACCQDRFRVEAAYKQQKSSYREAPGSLLQFLSLPTSQHRLPHITSTSSLPRLPASLQNCSVTVSSQGDHTHGCDSTRPTRDFVRAFWLLELRKMRIFWWLKL